MSGVGNFPIVLQVPAILSIYKPPPEGHSQHVAYRVLSGSYRYDMIIDKALAVIGIFLVGASAGATFEYTQYRRLVALCNDPFNRSGRRQSTGGMSSDEHGEELASETSGTAGIRRFELSDVWSDSVLTIDRRREFTRWADNLLTCLGAPVHDGERGRTLTMAERVEWLQARNG